MRILYSIMHTLNSQMRLWNLRIGTPILIFTRRTDRSTLQSSHRRTILRNKCGEKAQNTPHTAGPSMLRSELGAPLVIRARHARHTASIQGVGLGVVVDTEPWRASAARPY